MSTRNKIINSKKQLLHILSELQEIRCMIRGTYGKTYRKCGQPNCWCQSAGKGHPYHRMTWTKDGQAGTKSIPKEEIPWIQDMTKNYRRFRTLRSKLRMQERELKILLDKLEEEVILKTRKKRKYL